MVQDKKNARIVTVAGKRHVTIVMEMVASRVHGVMVQEKNNAHLVEALGYIPWKNRVLNAEAEVIQSVMFVKAMVA